MYYNMIKTEQKIKKKLKIKTVEQVETKKSW